MMRINNNVETLVSRMNTDTSRGGETLKSGSQLSNAAVVEDTVTISSRARDLARVGSAAINTGDFGKSSVEQLGSNFKNQSLVEDFMKKHRALQEEVNFQRKLEWDARAREPIPVPGPNPGIREPMQSATDAVTGNMQSLNNTTAALRSVQGSGSPSVGINILNESPNSIGLNTKTFSNSLLM
jgi:hypothetical protein